MDATTPSPPTPSEQPTLVVGAMVACPDTACDQPAEVLGTWVWSSTAGPVPHVRTRCLARHVFTPPMDAVVPSVPDTPMGASRRVASHA